MDLENCLSSHCFAEYLSLFLITFVGLIGFGTLLTSTLGMLVDALIDDEDEPVRPAADPHGVGGVGDGQAGQIQNVGEDDTEDEEVYGVPGSILEEVIAIRGWFSSPQRKRPRVAPHKLRTNLTVGFGKPQPESSLLNTVEAFITAKEDEFVEYCSPFPAPNTDSPIPTTETPENETEGSNGDETDYDTDPEFAEADFILI